MHQGAYSGEDHEILQAMRAFCMEKISTAVPTNRYAVNIDESYHSKEHGGTSYINDGEISYIMSDLGKMRTDPRFNGKSILVTSFYRAQITKLKLLCRALPSVTVLDANEHLSKLTCNTVESVQGAEYDVVLLSFVHTSHASFVGESHRLLVTLSRARFLLGLYTNWNLIEGRTTSHNRHLKALFSDLEAKKHVVDRAVPERPAKNHVVDRPAPEGPARNHLVNHPAPGRPDKRTCYSCKQASHIARDCPQPRLPTCNECKGLGHKRSECPEVLCDKCK